MFGTGGGVLELGQHPGHAARLGGGLLQLAHVARAAHGGQGFEGFGNFDVFSELGVEGAGGQAEFAHATGTAIGAGEAAFAGELVAVGQALVLEGVGQIQADDACLGQGDEFTTL